jgi:hypothetical protein
VLVVVLVLENSDGCTLNPDKIVGVKSSSLRLQARMADATDLAGLRSPAVGKNRRVRLGRVSRRGATTQPRISTLGLEFGHFPMTAERSNRMARVL